MLLGRWPSCAVLLAVRTVCEVTAWLGAFSGLIRLAPVGVHRGGVPRISKYNYLELEGGAQVEGTADESTDSCESLVSNFG